LIFIVDLVVLGMAKKGHGLGSDVGFDWIL
jgi:hypothetical protein